MEAMHVVLEETLAFLDKSDLSRLGRTCKVVHALTARDLYRTVHPKSLRRAHLFCASLKSNPSLGRLVRDLKFKFYGESIAIQKQFELDLQAVIPSLVNLTSFRWLLDTKPFGDSVWTLLGAHCRSLTAVELARADGLRPDSDIFRLSGLENFKISAWSSRLEPSTSSTVIKLPPNHAIPADPACLDAGRMSTLLLQSPNLATLHLNMTLRQCPTIDGLLAGRWPRLRELVLIPSPTHLVALQSHLVAFLSAHPSLRSLVLSHEPMFDALQGLPLDALPQIQVFEGSVKDTLTMLGGGEDGWRNEVKTLPRVVVNDATDLSALAKVFKGRRALATVALHVAASEAVSAKQLGEVCGSLQGVRKLKLDMQCGCKTLSDVTKSLQLMPEVRTLLLDKTFAIDRDPRSFAKQLSKTCPRLKFLDIAGNAYEVNRTKRSSRFL